MQLLDTPEEQVFDGITNMAKKLFDVPIAVMSLIDDERQWNMACVGLPVKEVRLKRHEILVMTRASSVETYLGARTPF